MADHEHPAPGGGERAQLLGLDDVVGDRLLHQHVLVVLERRPHERVVRARGRRDDNRVDASVGQHRGDVLRYPQVGKPGPRLLEPRRTLVDDPDDLARIAAVKVADQVRTPLARPDHGDADHRLSPRPT